MTSEKFQKKFDFGCFTLTKLSEHEMSDKLERHIIKKLFNFV